ncbi:MAG: glycoside hydrolase, partial [Spirosomataceae bacterium]
MKLLLFSLFLLISSSTLLGQNHFFDAMQWRMIGPHRGGRTVGAVGVPQQPNVFYIGVNNGGVWKTTDYGRTWKPIFDDQPTGSVGDIAVAPSNPEVLYVASGEGIQRPDLSIGDGVYKSSDGGKTWTNTGLNDGQQIGGIAIDPTNENRVFVAVLGHPYGPNEERGVYRTENGGKTWEKILYKNENTGAVQVMFDPKDPKIVYAVLWAARQGPWENGAWQGPESGLYKSTDGGNIWKKLSQGLPTFEQGLGRIGLGIAPSDPNRLYATVDAGENGGIYRSDDAGSNWYRTNPDEKLWGRGSDFAEIKVDPKNPDVLYSANVVAWKSVDGGTNWTAFRGAPGGDDYHRFWINPNNPDIILIAADQGAIITVNGGETFSSWYNQPTAQFYHVSTDNAFPYNVYGGQQESGSVGISSRGNDGQITFREWHPVGVEEYGYVAPDPLDPNIIYGGKITKFDKRTGQTQNIAPEAVRSGKYRFVRTVPVLFSPVDKKTLYFAGNVLFKTQNGGNSWQVISPDLTRETYQDIPASVGVYTTNSMKTMPRRGVIYTVAPSFKNLNTIWAGTDDGLMHLTRDGGKTWKDITPAAITAWSKVSLMEAGHFDDNTCYAAINRIRCDDLRPHIYRTHDGGNTWQEIVQGLPENEPINAVREDPIRKGLLFAGSERAVYVSFDDGDHWQSLRLNMPATSIRDLVIKDDDIVVGTHGRSFWILDDISPLRQFTATNNLTKLYKPQLAYRVRWNLNTDTPLPQEEPVGQNPPDGAIINYFLKEKASGEVTLEIVNAAGKVIRTFSSNDKPYALPPSNTPPYWVRPQQILSAEAGAHRFLWDMHYTPTDAPVRFPIAAIYQNTAPDATSPWVLPATYTVKLTVNGQTYTQPLTIKIDPRVKTTPAQLQQIHDLSVVCYEGQQKAQEALKKSEDFRKVARLTEEGLKKVMEHEAALKKVVSELATLQNIL